MTEIQDFSRTGNVELGDCYLTDNLVSNAGTVFRGFEATPLALIDLCQFIEAAILHDHLIIGGVGWYGHKLGERLQEEDIIRSGFIVGSGGIWEDKDESSPDDIFHSILQSVLNSLKTTGIFGRLFMSLPSDEDPDPSQRAMRCFDLATTLAGIRDGLIQVDDDAAEILEKGVGPFLDNYAQYGSLIAEVQRVYEIPVFSGATEQPILDTKAIDLATPEEASDLLMKTFGEHYRRQMGQIINAVPAPPLAGIVLKDARSIDDIIDQLLKYRIKFESFRKTAAGLRAAMLEARRERTTGIRDRYQRMRRELDMSLQRSVERLEVAAKPKRKLVFRIWDLAKLLDPRKMTLAGMEQAVEKAEMIDQSRTVEGVFEVISYFPSIPALDVIAKRLFRKQFDPAHLEKFTTGTARLAACYGLEEEKKTKSDGKTKWNQ